MSRALCRRGSAGRADWTGTPGTSPSWKQQATRGLPSGCERGARALPPSRKARCCARRCPACLRELLEAIHQLAQVGPQAEVAVGGCQRACRGMAGARCQPVGPAGGNQGKLGKGSQRGSKHDPPLPHPPPQTHTNTATTTTNNNRHTHNTTSSFQCRIGGGCRGQLRGLTRQRWRGRRRSVVRRRPRPRPRVPQVQRAKAALQRVGRVVQQVGAGVVGGAHQAGVLAQAVEERLDAALHAADQRGRQAVGAAALLAARCCNTALLLLCSQAAPAAAEAWDREQASKQQRGSGVCWSAHGGRWRLRAAHAVEEEGRQRHARGEGEGHVVVAQWGGVLAQRLDVRQRDGVHLRGAGGSEPAEMVRACFLVRGVFMWAAGRHKHLARLPQPGCKTVHTMVASKGQRQRVQRLRGLTAYMLRSFSAAPPAPLAARPLAAPPPAAPLVPPSLALPCSCGPPAV